MRAAVGGYKSFKLHDKVRISRERQKAPAFHTFATRSRGRIANRWDRLVFLRCGRGVEPFHTSSTCPWFAENVKPACFRDVLMRKVDGTIR